MADGKWQIAGVEALPSAIAKYYCLLHDRHAFTSEGCPPDRNFEYFSVAFKRICGETPGQYRARRRA